MESDARSDRSPMQANIRRVFVQRDFTQGTAVRFQVKYPLELEGKLPQSYFEETLKKVNSIFDNAEKIGLRTYTQGCFACVTAYLVYACCNTHYDKCMKKLAAYINEQNESVYVPRGLMLVNPMERGLRVIEICVQM
ncbi:golgin subfamily A member 7-like [Rhopilema esculentum]|uniref:golgin subfamily A member 7-like n=1 Tax=Rhopilema esculentum TaxID=499914 RepID=UPI0031DFB7AC